MHKTTWIAFKVTYKHSPHSRSSRREVLQVDLTKLSERARRQVMRIVSTHSVAPEDESGVYIETHLSEKEIIDLASMIGRCEVETARDAPACFLYLWDAIDLEQETPERYFERHAARIAKVGSVTRHNPTRIGVDARMYKLENGALRERYKAMYDRLGLL